MDSGFQTFLIIFSVVVGLILLAVNAYILSLYLHPDDKGIWRAPYGKIIIVLGLTICQAQALLVPLDVAFKSNYPNLWTNQLNMSTLWLILYIALLVLICLLIPFAIFFYETDSEDNLLRRLLRAFGYLFITFLISAAIFFISWYFLNYVDLPYAQIEHIYEDAQYIEPEKQKDQVELIVSIQASFAIYVVAVLSFCGWFLVVCFGGVGLFALPMDLINEFRHRPKVRKSEQMKQLKSKLVESIRGLIKEGEEIKQNESQYTRNEEAGCFEKFTGNRRINSKFTKFKVKYHVLSEEFNVFNLELKLADANPIIPIVKLILGIIFVITSLLWITQIILGNIAKKYEFVPFIPFLNNVLIYMEEHNAGLVSTAIFAYLCLYLMWCVQKGSIKMGMRIPLCCRFYPMTENQTAMNGFLVNVLFLVLASVGVIQLCVSSFPTYTRFSEVNSIYQVELKYMRFYKIFYEKSIFPIALVCWTLLTLLYLLATCNKKPAYMKELEELRQYHQEERNKLTN